jgi:predicted alpha/beta-hydrolase family hydrolase
MKYFKIFKAKNGAWIFSYPAHPWGKKNRLKEQHICLTWLEAVSNFNKFLRTGSCY